MSKFIHTLYKIINKTTEEFYIGIHKINTENHPDFNDGYLGSGHRIKASVKKYGKKVFKRIILAISEDLNVIVKLEEETVNQTLLDDPLCLNLALGGRINPNWNYSEETRKKMSEAQKGKVPWNKGIPRTEETKQKLRESNLGNKYALGCVRSEETKKKLSKASTGNKNALGAVWSEESRKQLSISKKGKPATNLGIPHSEETKFKISEANKGKVACNKGKICINNKIKNKFIFPEQLNQFIEEGWEIGGKCKLSSF